MTYSSRDLGVFPMLLGGKLYIWSFFNHWIVLKAVDTIGNYQALAFTVGVSQHMHNLTYL